ncbi:MAG: alpha/beta hydrolase [Bacteroidota bacterium]|nr:alpha/beta hydrolase [Bacteroidota bacterium]
MDKAIKKETEAIKVSGAILHYNTRGAGPMLLMIPAGGGDASTYDGVANFLADWYTVVCYDRRGYSNSVLENPDEVPSITSHADDIHFLLEKLTNAPAYIFGSSSGGVIALDFFMRYSTQIKALLLHEPAKNIIADPDEPYVDLSEVVKKGGMQALQKFIGLDFSEKKSAIGGEGAQREANMKFFISKEPKAIQQYQYNLDGLKAAAEKVPVVILGSTTAKDAVGHRGAEVAAEFFGKTIIDVPGNHAGYQAFPKEFAEKLHSIIEDFEL